MTWRTLVNQVLSSLFEPPCAACRRPLALPLDGAVCPDCWASLRLAPRLSERFAADHAVAWASAVDHYDGRMKDIIHALKYERRRSISPRLGALMRECGRALLADADIVVPVPLHPRREYERGFNQAEDLAVHLGVPMVRLLARVKHTSSQIELPRDQRRQNVKNAFAINPLCGSQLPLPAVIVLVDDVSTTGATIEACAKVLKEAGVKEVRALTAARVIQTASIRGPSAADRRVRANL